MKKIGIGYCTRNPLAKQESLKTKACYQKTDASAPLSVGPLPRQPPPLFLSYLERGQEALRGELRGRSQFKALVLVRQLVKMSEWCRVCVAAAHQHLAACAVCGFVPRSNAVTLLGL